MADKEDRELLAEFDELIRIAPTRAVVHQRNPENISWLGRCMAVCERWHSNRGTLARKYAAQTKHWKAIESPHGDLVQAEEATRSSCRMSTERNAVSSFFSETKRKLTPGFASPSTLTGALLFISLASLAS